MVAFAPVLQADLSGTAFGGSPTWTDITRFARLQASPVTVNAWRQDELTDVAPSTATIVLDNADQPGDATAPNAGRFTPDLTTSPFYPRIIPGVRMRFGVTVNTVTYWLIDGFVDSWDAEALDGEFPVCTVIVNDILAAFGTTNLLRSMMQETVLRDTPLVYLPLTDAAGVTSPSVVAAPSAVTFAIAASAEGAGSSTYAFDNGSGPVAEGTKALTLTNTASSNVGYGVTARGLNYTFTGTRWYLRINTVITSVPSWPADLIFMRGPSTFGGAPVLLLSIQPTGVGVPGSVVFQSANGGVAGPSLAGTVSICDGVPHDIVVELIPATNTANVYVDGVLAGTSSAGAALAAGPYKRLAVGGSDDDNGKMNGGLLSATVSHFAIYDVAGSIHISDHFAAGATGFAGEATDTHVARLLAFRTNLGSTLDVGKGSVGLHAIAGVSLQQALLDTAKAEGGVVYVDGTSKVVMLNRGRLRNPAVAATLDITAQQTTVDLGVRKDRQQVVNDATITRAGGGTQRVTDATSITANGVRAKSDTVIVATDLDALNDAGWLVANGKTARSRAPQLAVDLLTEPSLTVAQAVLALAPLSRVSLANAPSWFAAADVLVQGVSYTVGVDVFTASFYTSPLPRPTLRFDATADAFTKLDSGNVFAW